MASICFATPCVLEPLTHAVLFWLCVAQGRPLMLSTSVITVVLDVCCLVAYCLSLG